MLAHLLHDYIYVLGQGQVIRDVIVQEFEATMMPNAGSPVKTAIWSRSPFLESTVSFIVLLTLSKSVVMVSLNQLFYPSCMLTHHHCDSANGSSAITKLITPQGKIIELKNARDFELSSVGTPFKQPSSS